MILPILLYICYILHNSTIFVLIFCDDSIDKRN